MQPKINSGESHCACATHHVAAVAAVANEIGSRAQNTNGAQMCLAPAAVANEIGSQNHGRSVLQSHAVLAAEAVSGGDQVALASRIEHVPAGVCSQIGELQARRKFYIKLSTKMTNASGALVRRALGWRLDMPEAEQKRLNARAQRIVARALAAKDQAAGDEEISDALAADLALVAQTIAPLAAARHEIELSMARLGRTLPAREWQKGVTGLGDLALAIIVGEAGDLSNYPNPAKLWKRLGLAPYEGRACSSWRGAKTLTAEEWSELGYSPRRLAEIYSAVTEPLFRHQSMRAGPYRLIYDARRARTAMSHPDWSKAHSHNDALRIMTKRLIVDLWSEWRQATSSVIPIYRLPAADLSRIAAERAAPCAG